MVSSFLSLIQKPKVKPISFSQGIDKAQILSDVLKECELNDEILDQGFKLLWDPNMIFILQATKAKLSGSADWLLNCKSLFIWPILVPNFDPKTDYLKQAAECKAAISQTAL